MKGELIDLFWKLPGCFLFSRVGIVSTFIKLALPQHVRDSLQDKSMLFHSKKSVLLFSVWSGTEYNWALI